MMTESYERGFKMQVATKCDQTGWPIDISIKPSYFDAKNEKVAIYFLL